MNGIKILLKYGFHITGLAQHQKDFYVKVQSPLQEEEEAKTADNINEAIISCLSDMLQVLEERQIIRLGWLKDIRQRGFFPLLEEIGLTSTEIEKIHLALIDELLEFDYDLVVKAMDKINSKGE